MLGLTSIVLGYSLSLRGSPLLFPCFCLCQPVFLGSFLQNGYPLELKLNELKNVFQWLLSNKLSLNVKKSNFVIFRSARKKVPRKIKLEVNGDQIEQLESTKYLGVISDQNLNWKRHISHVSSKLSRYTGLLYKLRHFVPKNALLSLYNAFIMPHVNYALINWSSATETNLNPMKRCLKKAIRAICFAKAQAHSLPLFKKQNLLCFDDIVELEIGKFMYSIENKTLDTTFFKCFKKQIKDIRDVHDKRLEMTLFPPKRD